MVKIKLNLGSGNVKLPGFTNLDGKFGDDITNLIYENESVSEIYVSHVLSYFDREEVIDVLREWYRVLKPNGELYLSVPDFRAMADLYLNENKPLHRFVGPLFGKIQMGGDSIYHKTVYDYSSLGELLKSNKFKRVELYETSDLIKLVDDQSKALVDGTPISLNIRCIK